MPQNTDQVDEVPVTVSLCCHPLVQTLHFYCPKASTDQCFAQLQFTNLLSVRCEHHRLSINKRQRLVITQEAWQAICKCYPESTEFRVSLHAPSPVGPICKCYI